MGDLMPRIRTVKPEFWDSPDTARADLRTRLLYIAMWNWANDHGIGDATPVRLIAFAFPRDEIPAADYPTLLKDVSDAFGVVFFEHLGRPYFAIPAWELHQRTEKKARVDEALLQAALRAIEFAKPAGQDAKADSPKHGGGSSAPIVGESVAGTGEVGTEEEETSSSATPPRPEAHRDDVEALCARLRDHVVANGSRAVVTKAWRREARLLLDRDGRELDKALNLIDWCQQDSFWRRNILSMPKFREKFDQLRLAAIADHEKRRGSPPGGLSKREQKIAEAERFKSNPDPEVLRRAGLEPGPGLRALPGGNS